MKLLPLLEIVVRDPVAEFQLFSAGDEPDAVVLDSQRIGNRAIQVINAGIGTYFQRVCLAEEIELCI